MTALKEIARDFLPPIAVRLLLKMRGGGVGFVGNYTTWAEAQAKSIGYDADDILTKVLDATLKVKHGEAAFERDSVVFDKIEYSWPVLAGLLWAATRNGGRLNVLDFGGALGSSYFQNRKFLEDLADVRWNVVEQAHYVRAGQDGIQDECLRFYESIDDCLEQNCPNVILLSGVLQYLESPHDIVARLSHVDADILIIDRTPFAAQGRDHLVIQHVPPSIYAASYPMWVFAREGFMHVLQPDWRLVASAGSLDGKIRAANGLNISFEGILLERRG